MILKKTLHIFFILFFLNLHGECVDINKNNYFSIFKDRVSGYYKSDLNDNCILISFYENDEVFKLINKENNFFFIKDGLNVVHKGSNVYLKFNKEGAYYNFVYKNMKTYTPNLITFYEKFIILHEMFHFSKIDNKNNIYKKEVYSDIMAINFLYNTGEIKKENLISSINEIKRLRINMFNIDYKKSNHNSLYDKFNEYIKNDNFNKINKPTFSKIRNETINLLEN